VIVTRLDNSAHTSGRSGASLDRLKTNNDVGGQGQRGARASAQPRIARTNFASAEDVVVVVGAGLVGLSCAYSLAVNGFQPLVIDANDPGTGASWGNAGLIAFAPEIVAPVPGPGVVGTSLRWLCKRNSPLRLVPSLNRDYVRWLCRFVVSCSEDSAAAGLHATVALNADTPRLFDALEDEGLEFEMDRRGILIVFRSRRSFESARVRLTRNGGAGRALSREAALEIEPLLQSSACAGAIRYEDERQVRPDKLVGALVARLERMAVEVRTGSTCTGIIRDEQEVLGLRTSDGIVRGREYVLASGTGLSQLAKGAGVRIPLQAGRGYSFDVRRDELPLRSPVYLYESRLTLTPFRDFTRVVGMMELGARIASVRPRAIEAMHRVGAASFRVWPRTAPRDAWAGLRPMTPDGLPLIGPVEGLSNLYIAGGHGMLGVTLSLATGNAIVECIGGQRTGINLHPFDPGRFT
jgi:D-amino-acid dehydrogenase